MPESNRQPPVYIIFPRKLPAVIVFHEPVKTTEKVEQGEDYWEKNSWADNLALDKTEDNQQFNNPSEDPNYKTLAKERWQNYAIVGALGLLALAAAKGLNPF